MNIQTMRKRWLSAWILAAFPAWTLSQTGDTGLTLTPPGVTVNVNPTAPVQDATGTITNNSAGPVVWKVAGIRDVTQESLPPTLASGPINAARQASAYSLEKDFSADEIIVGLKDGSQAQTQLNANAPLSFLSGKVKMKRKLGRVKHPSRKGQKAPKVRRGRDLVLMKVEGKDRNAVLEAIANLRKDPNVAYAEPNYRVKAIGIPNDPDFSRLYGMHNNGQTGGIDDADIDAPEAWDTHTGGEILVGVIDTGIDYLHPDLVDNMWTNPGEIPGNGIDDDSNGYVDDVYGYDFANDDSDPMDDHYHGTHVAGTIAASGNNGIGVAGVCWRAKLVALKFLDAGGSGSLSDAVDAIAYANAMGIPITSNSWGGGGYSQALKDAIDAAGQRGFLFVAAAGNSGNDLDKFLDYPAGYDSENIISVAASDASDQLAWFSNFGKVSVDLAAPGVDVYSCQPGNQYQFLSGTSMATPHVSGAAALLWTYNPQLTGAEIKAALMNSVDHPTSLQGSSRTDGRMNIAQALNAIPAPWITFTPKGEQTLLAGQSQPITAQLDATHLIAGTHRAQIMLATDLASQPSLNWDITAQVTGCRQLSLASDTLVFPKAWVGHEVKATMHLTNSCNDTTTVTRITGFAQGFQALTTLPLRLPPFGGVDVEFGFTATQTGPHFLAVELQSNADSDANPTLVLQAEAVPPPALVVSPASISEALGMDQTLVRTITVTNSGGDVLDMRLKAVTDPNASVAKGKTSARQPALIPGKKGEGSPFARTKFHAKPGNLKPTFKATASDLRVLYLTTLATTGDDFFITGLKGLPNVAQVDVVDGSYQTPNLEFLQQYDQVVVSSNYPWSDANALGNVLADYVDEGGRLCLLVASIAAGGGYSLDGRITGAEYMPIEMAYGGMGGDAASFANHPINTDVTQLSSIGATSAMRTQGNALALGAYYSGELIGAVNQDKPIVAINVFPMDGLWGGDLIRMMGNTFDFLSGQGTWLSIEPTRLSLLPGESAEVTVTLNGEKQTAGLHTGSVSIAHNVPAIDNPFLLPVQITVAGMSRLAMDPTKFDFGKVFVGDVVHADFTLTNIGNQATTIHAIELEPDFQLTDALPLVVPPFKKITFGVDYRPTTIRSGAYRMTVNSDAADFPVLAATFRATSLAAPVAVWDPNSLSVSMAYNAAPQEYTVVLKNEGGHDLSWRHTGTQITSNSRVAPKNLTSKDFARIDGALQSQKPFKLGEVIVAFKSGYADFANSTAITQVGATLKRRLAKAQGAGLKARAATGRQSILLQLPTATRDGVLQAIAAFKADPNVAYAEPNYRLSIGATPNDPEYERLYGLHNIGQTGGVDDADVDAPEAWDTHTGGNVLVGIIDTGIDYLHPDLAENIWTNPGEIPGNGLDDDGNGYADDIHGWDFANDDADPMDDHFHGTHVAGTIAGVGNNGVGVVGVCWKAQMVGLKFLDAGGSGYTDDAVDAVAYANAMGISITSNSWGGGGYSQTLKDIIDEAGARGYLFVAAAGNSGSNLDIYPDYPAGYDSPNILSVAATDASDNLAYFSNFGAVSVDLGAPGVDIYSCDLRGGYQFLSGTSMATPHVSGAAALLLSYHPQSTADELKTLLLQNVDPIPSLEGITLSNGRLNVQKALAHLSPPWLTLTPTGTGVVAPEGTQSFTVRIDPSSLIAGSHSASVNFTTNDPLHKTLSFPIAATVSSCRNLTATPVAVDFGTTWVGQQAVRGLQLVNTCNDTTIVTAVTGQGKGFSVVSGLPLRVPPFGTATLEIAFAPTAKGKVSKAFTIKSNAEDHPTISINLAGTAVLAPTIEATPTTFAMTLDPDQIKTKTMTIRNRGGAPLDVALRFKPDTKTMSKAGPGKVTRTQIKNTGKSWVTREGGRKSSAQRPSFRRQAVASATGLKVLYLTTVPLYWNQIFLQDLKSMPQIGELDTLDGSYGTPDAAYLAGFDQVIVSATMGWADPEATGNALADYIDAGGRVTMLVASFASGGGYSLGGRIMTADYLPIESAGPGNFSETSTFIDHPITQGMTSLSSYYPTAAIQTFGDGISLGAYSNGQLIGAYHPSHPLVALNVYPEDYTWEGDLMLMIANTIDYLQERTNWLKVEPKSLVVAPGKSKTVTLSFDGHGLDAGSVSGNLQLVHNAPASTNPLLIPVSMNVNAKRCLSAEATLDFGKVWLGASSVQELHLKNDCNEPTTVSRFAILPPAFTIDLPTPTTVPARGEVVVKVTYTPKYLIPGLGALVIQSNAANNPLHTVVLKGTPVKPPAIQVAPGSLSYTGDPGQVVTQNVQVKNSGGDDLRVNIYPTTVDASASVGSFKSQGESPNLRVNRSKHSHPPVSSILALRGIQAQPISPSSQDLHPKIAAAGQPMRVLYLESTQFDTTQYDSFIEGLRYLPNISQLDIVHGMYATPNLAYLKQYDAVIVARYYYFADNKSVGDALADYVDMGGRVLLMGQSFEQEKEDTTGFGRIFVAGYCPLKPAGFSFYNDSPTFTNHAINENVAYLNSLIGVASDSVQGDGVELGRYASGYLVGAYSKARPVVALNVAPIEYYWSGDLITWVGNALNHLSQSVSWLYASQSSWVIPAGKTVQIPLTFNTHYLPPHVYQASLHFEHNAPNQSSPFSIPVSLTVNAKKCLSLSSDSLNFGKVWNGQVGTLTVQAKNECNEATTIFSSNTPAPFGLIDTLPVEVPAFGEIAFNVTYTPTEVGQDRGVLTLNSDAGDHPSLNVVLKGNALNPPTISATPELFDLVLRAGETQQREMTIRNDGGDSLTVTVNAQVERRGGDGNPPPPDSIIPPPKDTIKPPKGFVDREGKVPSRAGTLTPGQSRFTKGLVPAAARIIARDTLPSDTIPQDSGSFGKRLLYIHTMKLDTAWDPVVWQMRYSPGVGSVDLLDATYQTPDAAYLAAYDLVVVASDMPWADADAMGNALAEYTDVGGRILLMGGCWSSQPGVALGGRFISGGYSPFGIGGYHEYGYAYEFESHPITRNVYYIESWASTVSMNMQGSAKSLGLFHTGSHVGGYQPDQPIAALNVMPAYYLYNGYFLDMVSNSVDYLLRYSSIVKMDPKKIMIPPGGSAQVQLTFGDDDAVGGEYDIQLNLKHNDPAAPNPYVIPVHLEIESIHELRAIPDSLDLGVSQPGWGLYGSFELQNRGNTPEFITEIVSDNPDLSLYWYLNYGEALEPGASIWVYCYAYPQAPGPFQATVTVRAENQVIEVPVTGLVLAPAELVIASQPDPLHFILNANENAVGELLLSNIGGDFLDYSLRFDLAEQPSAEPPQPKVSLFADAAYQTLTKGAIDTRVGPKVTANAGGPDSFGNRWQDSRSAFGPAYVFEDIRDPNHLMRSVSGCDDCSETLELPFSFPFYGEGFDAIHISSNGYVTLSPSNGEYSHTPLPAKASPANLIAPFFTDLYPPGQGAIYAQAFDDRVVVLWDGVADFAGTGTFTFELILHNDGTMQVAYADMNGTLTSSTVGIQNGSRTDGLTVAFNTEFVADSVMLQMRPWLGMVGMRGHLGAGDAQTSRLIVNSTGLPVGIHTGVIEATGVDISGYPSVRSLPITLEVTEPLEAESKP